MLKTSIPFIDLRDRTPMDLLRAYPDKARALVRSARRTYGGLSNAASFLLLPLADRWSHRWLERTGNPYLHEIESMSDILEMRGVYSLNLCYEWGCTGGAYRHGETVSMLRLLDWPFPALGKQAVVVCSQGKAGIFYNVTWPGLSGVYTGMAPGRFAAAINMAPMRKHGRSLIGDWCKNRARLWRQNGLPPSHALRQVFEKAADYKEAKEMLASMPLAAPAIYILTGINPGEGCTIERFEHSAQISELSAGLSVGAANHFTTELSKDGKGWRPRLADSPERYRQACSIGGHDLDAEHFNWLRAPMVNSFTRLCVIADATNARLMVQGFEGTLPVTELFNLPVAVKKQQATGTAWN